MLLDEERYRRVSALARLRGTSVAAAIRGAIDRGLPSLDDDRIQAGRRVLDAEQAQVPDVPDLLAELEELRGRRG